MRLSAQTLGELAGSRRQEIRLPGFCRRRNDQGQHLLALVVGSLVVMGRIELPTYGL